MSLPGNKAESIYLKYFVHNSLTSGLFILLIKYILYLAFIASLPNLVSHFVRVADFDELVTPIDNYFSSGTYSLTPDGEPFAGRLPGFIFPYILFRILFDPELSVFLLGIFILLFSVYSGVVTIQFVYSKTKSQLLSFISAVILVLFPFYWHWEWTIHPNSLSVSCVSMVIIFFDKFIQAQKNKYLLICGFFLGWIFMLRGFTFLFLPITLMLTLYFFSKNNYSLKKSFTAILVLILPFGMMESGWIIRNAVSINKFIPLQTALVPGGANTISYYNYANPVKSSMLYVRDLISCWGGDNFWYFKNADMHWFVSRQTPIDPVSQFPAVTFKSGIEPKELLDLKNYILISFSDSLTKEEHEEAEGKIISLSTELRTKFLKKETLYYYTIAPLRRIKNYLFKNVTQDWPGRGFAVNNPVQKMIKVISLASYGLVLLAFLISLLRYFKKYTLSLTLILSLGLSLIFLFALANTSHFSYFMCGYYCFGLFSLLLFAPKSIVKSGY